MTPPAPFVNKVVEKVSLAKQLLEAEGNLNEDELNQWRYTASLLAVHSNLIAMFILNNWRDSLN